MSDLISREAAIEALQYQADFSQDKDYADGETLLYESSAIDVIKNLPAEEIPKCKDCYWWTKQDDSLQGRCARYGFYPTGYWYCAAARERRDDG